MDKEYIDREAVALKVRRYIMPNVDIDGTVYVQDAERYFLRLLDTEPAAGVIEVDKFASKIAGHSYYHGDKILASLYCMKEGQEIEESIEPADVVRVVRCKYCEHYEPYDKPVEDFDGRCSIKGHETDEMEFCSYGVKKDVKSDAE